MKKQMFEERRILFLRIRVEFHIGNVLFKIYVCFIKTTRNPI